jgi:hypothetical protein
MDAQVANSVIKKSRRFLMEIMDSSGDTKKTWDPDTPFEVEEARKSFDAHIAKGYVAFSVGDKGAKGQKIKKFDPDAGSLILVPPIVGG